MFTRKNPFFASLKERYSLCRGGKGKDTTHLVVDISGSEMRYAVGDCLAILPTNDPERVDSLCARFGFTGAEMYQDRRSGTDLSLREYLLSHANLDDSSLEKTASSVAEFCASFRPLMPRFYSIASSQKAVGEEVHLTIGIHRDPSSPLKADGVCTHFLCDLTPLHQRVLPVYLHPHRGFTLPEDPSVPVIMVGPGTGVAPFRGFMQEREALSCSGKNWLFFGEWHRSHHYFYEEFWTGLAASGRLRIDLAFSRDQAEKIYVQNRLLEHGAELFAWLKEGAHFYVCGDAARMAKDVDHALHSLVQKHGGLSEEGAREFVKALRKEKRYLRDVY